MGRKDRNALVGFIRERHVERFFEPITLLGEAKGNSQGHGFAMMSLCSLLVETIQCYRDGLPTTYGPELNGLKNFRNVPPTYQIPQTLTVNGRNVFRDFFQHYKKELDGIDGVKFYKNIRNGLLHQAQTKGGWRINMARQRLFARRIIDRDKFALGLEQAFDSYLEDLTDARWESDVWTKARRKIWWLIRLS